MTYEKEKQKLRIVVKWGPVGGRAGRLESQSQGPQLFL